MIKTRLLLLCCTYIYICGKYFIYFLNSISGELLGVEYLFRQTGQPLQDMAPDSEATMDLLEEVEETLDEGFSEPDIQDPTIHGLLPAAREEQPAVQPATPAPQPGVRAREKPAVQPVAPGPQSVIGAREEQPAVQLVAPGPQPVVGAREEQPAVQLVAPGPQPVIAAPDDQEAGPSTSRSAPRLRVSFFLVAIEACL